MTTAKIRLSNMSPGESVLDTGPAKCAKFDKAALKLLIGLRLIDGLQRRARQTGGPGPLEAWWLVTREALY
jgi:hypothetical protein